MRYAGLIKDDFNNGKGIGLTLFTQYCPHHCKGCQNPETWSKTGGKEYTQEVHREIIDYFKNTPYATRLTLSGGDPIYSPQIVIPLCEEVKKIRPDVKIWLYSGCIYEDVSGYPLMEYIDVMIDGPFILEQRDITLPFRGSSNQRIIDVQQTLDKGETILYEQYY